MHMSVHYSYIYLRWAGMIQDRMFNGLGASGASGRAVEGKAASYTLYYSD